MEIRQRAQTLKIGAEVSGEVVVDHGVDSEAVFQWDRQDPQEADLEADGDEEDAVILQILILWLATGVGCVVIWPVTVPKLEQHRREVAMLALPMEHSLNPGKKTQEDVAEVARCDLGALMCCMMRTGIPIPWMMQVNCTSPSNLHQILAMVRLRRENKIKQKAKKDICQCGLCWCHM